MGEISNEIKESVQKTNNKSLRLKIFLYAAFFAFTVFISGFLGIYTAINLSKLSLLDMFITLMPQVGFDNQANILVLGVDNTVGSKRTDTIMVVHVDIARNRVGVLAIPRDSRVDIPGHGYDKINHAYAYGGVELVKQTVSEFFQIPIDHYCEVNIQGVVKIIDQLGGITVDVKKRMYYVDKAGDLYIDLQPGEQILSGKDAIGYVRYRKDVKGDIGRIRRQQNFMKAVAKKIIDSGNIFRAPQIFKELTSNFVTNMTTKQILHLALKMRTAFMANQINIDTVPGAVILLEGISYWRPDVPSTLKVVDKVLHGFGTVEEGRVASVAPVQTSVTKKSIVPVTQQVQKKQEDKELGPAKRLTSREIRKIAPSLKNVKDGEVLPEKMHLSVEVLNGCGIPLVAQEIARNLKSKGVKVPWIGNAAHFDYENTMIVDWKGLTKEVMHLANSLKVDPKNIVTYYKPKKKLDVTLVIGKDWNEIKNRL